MTDSVQRKGVNVAESSLLRAVAEHGGEADLANFIEPGPAKALRPILERLEELDEEAREELTHEWVYLERQSDRHERKPGRKDDRWVRARRSWYRDEAPFEWIDSEEMKTGLRRVFDERSSGRLPEQLLSDDPHHFDRLLGLELDAFRELVADFGVFQLAELVRQKNRRRIARVVKKLSESQRKKLLDALTRERECDRIEKIRIREVFVTLSDHFDSFDQRVFELGLYSVACASGYRFRRRLEQLSEQLPDRLAQKLRRYYRLAHSTTRRGVGRHFRAALETFLAWRDETLEGDETS